MEKHNPIFSLKNFRSFGEEGADFELAPITVLTGCNSAGKSSMAKALMLMSNLPKERDTICPSLKLYSKDLGLGQFDKILNLAAQKKEIEFSYEIWSNYLQELVIVRRYFKAQKSDALNDGYLCRYSVEKKDGTVIYEKGTSIYGMEKEKKVNFEAVRYNFDRFLDVAKYMQLKKRTMEIEVELKHINNEIKEKYSEVVDREEKEYVNKIEMVTAVVEKYGINIIDSYKYKQLNSWNSWYEKREAKIERTKNNKILDDEQMELHYPKDEPLERFMELAIDEVFSPWFIEGIEYVDSASASIRRVYSIEEDNKMNKALRVLNSRSVVDYELCDIDIEEIEEEGSRQPGCFINKWMKKFGLGDGIEISGDEEGGVKAYLKNGNKKRLLADEGYGVTQLVSLLLIIENAIRSATDSEIPIKDGKPEFQQIAVSRPSRYICVEEPENHLHPKFQSLLADMFVEAYQKYNIHFIIETHSEYLIRRLQVMVADKNNTLSTNDVSLNYVEKDENGTSHNRQIRIMENGRLDGSFGKGFYDEAGGLSRQLFILNE